MDFGHFRKAVDRAADSIAPTYKAAQLATAPLVLTALGVPFLTPVVVAGLEAAPARDVLAIGLAPATFGTSLFLFDTTNRE